MLRQIPSRLRTAFQQKTTQVVVIAFLDFGPNQSDAVFAHSSVGDIRADLALFPPFNGMQTYVGLGNLAGGYDSQEDPSDRPVEYKLTLSGIDAELISHARNLDHIGREAKVWLGALDVATGELIGANEVKTGEMDRLEWSSGQSSRLLESFIQDERALMNKGPGILLDDGQQRTRNANDGFCRASLYEHKEVVSGPGAQEVTNARRPSDHEYDNNPYRNERFR